MNLTHYTLNTNDAYDCQSKNFDPYVIKTIVGPYVQQALQHKKVKSPLPGPLKDYSVELEYFEEGGALITILDAQDSPLTLNAVAWTEEGARLLWQKLETVAEGTMPQRLPWLATYVFPNENVLTCNWLADCEQCFAVSFIHHARQDKYKGRGRGFGV